MANSKEHSLTVEDKWKILFRPHPDAFGGNSGTLEEFMILGAYIHELFPKSHEFMRLPFVTFMQGLTSTTDDDVDLSPASHMWVVERDVAAIQYSFSAIDAFPLGGPEIAIRRDLPFISESDSHRLDNSLGSLGVRFYYSRQDKEVKVGLVGFEAYPSTVRWGLTLYDYDVLKPSEAIATLVDTDVASTKAPDNWTKLLELQDKGLVVKRPIRRV